MTEPTDQHPAPAAAEPDQTEPDQTEPDQTEPDQTEPDQTEPADSSQRRLVEQVAAYEVDPPAPERTPGDPR